MRLDALNNGFFNHIEYNDENLKNNNVLSQMERAAQVCRAPSRWLMTDLFHKGTIHQIFLAAHLDKFTEIKVELAVSQRAQKVMRIVLGILLSIPGQILALPLMAMAYLSEEIRLKRKVSVRLLTTEEHARLQQLLQEREKLEKERQGEPITCSILCSICCLLCCLVCK